MREQSEKVENVLHHFADDKSKKAKILARIVDRERRFRLGSIRECNVQLTKLIMFVVWQKPFHDKTHGRYFL